MPTDIAIADLADDIVQRLRERAARNHRSLQGELRAVKARFGRNHVQIEYEGDGDFLRTEPTVQSLHNFGNYVEIELKPGADPQKLLVAAAGRVRINRFELAEPTLEKIFIDTVKPNGKPITTENESVQHA